MTNPNIDNELWKPVVGYKGLYEVSSHGRIKSLGGRRGSKGGILKPANTKGYHSVQLCINNKPKTYQVHHLVATAFIGSRLIDQEVNHKDGDKQNNHLDNLEWVDHPTNMNHAVMTGLVGNAGEGHGMHKLREVDVRQILKSRHESNVELAQRYGVSDGTISDIRNRRTWRHLDDEGVKL